ARLLGSRRDRIEPDVSKKDDRGGAGDPFKAVRSKGSPIFRPDVHGPEHEKERDNPELDYHQGGVDVGGFTNPDQHHHGHEGHNAESWKVENQMKAEQLRRLLKSKGVPHNGRVDLR